MDVDEARNELTCQANWYEKAGQEFALIRFQDAVEIADLLKSQQARIAALEAQGEREIPLDVLYGALRSSVRHGEKLRWEDLEDGAIYLCVRHTGERLSIQQFTPRHPYPWHCGNEFSCWTPYLKIGEPDLTYLDDDEEEPLTPPAEREAEKEGTAEA